MIKSLNKVNIEGACLGIINTMHDKPTADITHNDEG